MRKIEGFQPFVKPTHHFERLIFSAYKGNGQGETHLPIDDVDGDDTEEASRPFARSTAHCIWLYLRRLAVKWLIMLINGRFQPHFLHPAWQASAQGRVDFVFMLT